MVAVEKRDRHKATSNGKWQNSNGKSTARTAKGNEDLAEKPKITAREMNERLLDYGARVIKLVEALPRSLAARRIGDQWLRSSIAVGAQAGESREDFVHKLQLALKELRNRTTGSDCSHARKPCRPSA